MRDLLTEELDEVSGGGKHGKKGKYGAKKGKHIIQNSPACLLEWDYSLI